MKTENRIYNMNYITTTTSLSGSTWNHCLFHYLPSPQIFNSNFHGTNASYVQSLSPKCSFSVSNIHDGYPSDFSNFDGTQTFKPNYQMYSGDLNNQCKFENKNNHFNSHSRSTLH